MIIAFNPSKSDVSHWHATDRQILVRDWLGSACLELVESQIACGAQIHVEALLEEASKLQSYAAIIDTQQTWNPSQLSSEALRHILWVRCREQSQALRAADVLIRDENFRIILIDLRTLSHSALKRIPQSHWYRLQRIAQNQNSTLIAATSFPSIAASQLRIEIGAHLDLSSFHKKRSDLSEHLNTSIIRQRTLSPQAQPWIQISAQKQQEAQAS
ncbi:MAG: hypothetical protein ACPGN3_06820 [Opitutales bacterium]